MEERSNTHDFMSVEKMLLYFYWIYPGGEEESTLSHNHQIIYNTSSCKWREG